MKESEPAPGYIKSMMELKCPRCRRGPMFKHKNPYKKINLKHMLDMPERCEVCHQKFELETGFWYGTGYVSYGLAVVFSVFTFILWWLILGFSIHDNSLFYWLTANGIIIVLLQPWFMRLSRTMYLYLFVKYDPNYKSTETIKFT